MRSSLKSLLTALVCASLVTGCGGGGQNALPAGPSLNPLVGSHAQLYDRAHPAEPIIGVYVSQEGPLLQYNYTGKGTPVCSLSGASNASGNVQSYSRKAFNGLIVPEYSPSSGGSVAIYDEGTKHQCLPSTPLATFGVPFHPTDAATVDGTIYYVAGSSASTVGVEVCYLTRQRPGCRRELTPPPNGTGPPIEITGVTADSTGVYADVGYPLEIGFVFSVVYWKGATGMGTLLGGLTNTEDGTLTFDALHNLLAMDGTNLYVYSGCPDACTEHGPFPLHGISRVGSLGNGDTTFMALEAVIEGRSQIDVYQYNGTDGITYLYSNKKGFTTDSSPLGIAQRLN